MIVVMGIDPSLRQTGYCIISAAKSYPARDNFNFIISGVAGCALKNDASQDERLGRFDMIVETLTSVFNPILEQASQGIVAIEGHAFGSKFHRNYEVPELVGVFKYGYWRQGLHIMQIPPTQARKTALGIGSLKDKRTKKERKPLVLAKLLYPVLEERCTEEDEIEAFIVAKAALDIYLKGEKLK